MSLGGKHVLALENSQETYPYNKDTLFIPNGAHIIGIHINQDTLLMTGNVGHFVLTMSRAPYFTGTDLIGLWHELLAMYLTHSVGNEVL